MPGSERSPALSEVISGAIEAQLLELHVSIPGKVERYDSSKQLVDVKPLIKGSYFDEEDARQVESLPVIPNVPVLFPGGGGYRVTFPVAVGDFCLLIFSDSSLDRWLSGSGQEVDPGFDHAHALTDAVALVGIRPFGAAWTKAPTDEATLGKDDGVQIHLEAGTITIGDKSGSDYVALAQKVLDELQKISQANHAHTVPTG
jgi:hypothetical protein